MASLPAPPHDPLVVTLTGRTAARVRALVAEGGFDSPDAAVADVVASDGQSDPLHEEWLREVVAPIYDRLEADPLRALSADMVRAELAAAREARKKAAT